MATGSEVRAWVESERPGWRLLEIPLVGGRPRTARVIVPDAGSAKGGDPLDRLVDHLSSGGDAALVVLGGGGRSRVGHVLTRWALLRRMLRERALDADSVRLSVEWIEGAGADPVVSGLAQRIWGEGGP